MKESVKSGKISAQEALKKLSAKVAGTRDLNKIKTAQWLAKRIDSKQKKV